MRQRGVFMALTIKGIEATKPKFDKNTKNTSQYDFLTGTDFF